MNKSYDDSNWRSEYIDLCSWRLKARQIELLDIGPDSLSASWLLGAMYQDWKKIKGIPPEPEPPDCSSSFKDWEKSIKKYNPPEASGPGGPLQNQADDGMYDDYNDPYGGH